MSDAESAKTQTHSAKTALFHRFSPNGSALWRPHPLKARTGRQHAGELRHPRLRHAGDTPSEGFAWRKTPFAAGVEGAGGTGRHGRDWWAWLRCPWAVAGPGWALNQRVQPHISDTAPLVWKASEGQEGLAAVPVGGGGAWPGFETTRRAKLACGDLAGGRARRRPEHPWGHKQSPRGTYLAHQAPPGIQRQHTAKGPKRRSASGPSRVSVAHRLSWMLRPGTASISSRV